MGIVPLLYKDRREYDERLLKSDVLLSEFRCLDVFERRILKDKCSYYTAERWFKPPIGFLRVFVPSYFKMALRFLDALSPLNLCFCR